MKKYGVWNCIILSNDGEVVRCSVTATSGKNARQRVEARYEGCEVIKMTRVGWMTGFSYEQLSAAVSSALPEYVNEIMDILIDCGLFADCKSDINID